MCFFRNTLVDEDDKYHGLAATLELDKKVRRCATDLKDGELLAKLSGGDMGQWMPHTMLIA